VSILLQIVAQIVAAITSSLLSYASQRQQDLSRDQAMTNLGAASSVIKGQADELARARTAIEARSKVSGLSDDDLDKWL
jgi:hypothetical protein